jgi:hypothetical protein
MKESIIMNTSQVVDIKWECLAFLDQDNDGTPGAVGDSQFIEDIGIKPGEHCQAKIRLEYCPEHLLGDLSGFIQLIGTEGYNVTFLHCRLDNVFKYAVGVFPNLRAFLAYRADDEAMSHGLLSLVSPWQVFTMRTNECKHGIRGELVNTIRQNPAGFNHKNRPRPVSFCPPGRSDTL